MLNTIYKEATSIADFKAGTSLDGKFNFLLSSPFEEDAYLDLVGDPDDPNYGWDLSVFRKNPAAFYGHDTAKPPIARWENVAVKNGALRGTLVFPEKGLSPFADEIRALCEAGIVRGVSVGFRPTKSKPRANGGTHWLRMTLMEASVCGIPAHPSALMEARQLGISEETIQKVFKMTTPKVKPESVGERIRRARRVVAKARRILEKTSNPKSRAALLRTIAILEHEDRAAMAASVKLPASHEAKVARSKAATARARAILQKTSPSGQQRRQEQKTIENFTAAARAHADPLPPKQEHKTPVSTWRGRPLPPLTWRGRKV